MSAKSFNELFELFFNKLQSEKSMSISLVASMSTHQN